MTRAHLRLVTPDPVLEPRRREPSDAFLRLTRNPDVEPPVKVVRTRKAEGDVVI